MSIVKLLKIDGVSTPLDVGLAFGEPALSESGQLWTGLPCLPPAEADSLKFRWRLPVHPALGAGMLRKEGMLRKKGMLKAWRTEVRFKEG